MPTIPAPHFQTENTAAPFILKQPARFHRNVLRLYEFSSGEIYYSECREVSLGSSLSHSKPQNASPGHIKLKIRYKYKNGVPVRSNKS